jgi:hypothetical protein
MRQTGVHLFYASSVMSVGRREVVKFLKLLKRLHIKVLMHLQSCASKRYKGGSAVHASIKSMLFPMIMVIIYMLSDILVTVFGYYNPVILFETTLLTASCTCPSISG